MSEAFRQKVIRTLIDEIALLTGGRFEQFGYRMMEVIHPAQWVERGTTVEGAPRGYTVDNSAAGSALVAEMSSASDYFHGDPLDKPIHDLCHAIKLHPNAKRIWLLSSREAAAGETTKCADLATQFMKLHESVMDVEILDARKIAGHVFDNLDVERFVSGLTSYLPSIGRLADENAFSHRIPIYSGYQPRIDLEQVVIDQLSDDSCVVVSGISGIGKSALAARVAQMLQQDFDAVIWFDAHDLRNVAELSDVDVRRVGTRYNIAGQLRRHKCLLILDDTLLSQNHVAEMECGESKVILTCQTTSDPHPVTVRDLDYASARSLLEAGVSIPCPDDLFRRVYANVGGYPLLLAALNRLAQDEGWEAVDDCCEEAVVVMEDERHNKVCQRILIRHREALAVELEFIKWCGESRFDSELSAICVSTRAVNNLQKRGFLAATVFGESRVHDVVYRSIYAIIDVSAQCSAEFRDKLDNFIRTECENEKSALRRIVNRHALLFKRLVRLDPRPSFVYAVALARTADTPLNLFGDLVATARSIAAYDYWRGREIEIRAVIEAVEALYTITSANRGSEIARTSLQENITALELLCASPVAIGELLRDLKHHYAKMLVRLGKISEAESEFRAILSEHPTFAAGRLQLARTLERTQRKQDALDECKNIIIQHEVALTRVSAPVLLEALRLVATLGTPDDLRPYETLIMSSLAEAHEFDRALASRLIASVAQKTWFTLPQLVSRMFDSIEWHDVVPVSDSERFDWAQAHKIAAKVTDVGNLRRREFLIAADEAYKSIVGANHYHIVQHSEALILLEEFDEANKLLDRVDSSQRQPYWWQRKAQALLGLKSADAALEAINHGLHDLGDQKYKPAFLHVRYQIRKYLSDPEAQEDLKDAIALLPSDDKYRKALESELNDSI
jgi:hypothetical protein